MWALASIRARLLVSGAVFIVMALALALLAVRPALDEFVRRSLDATLEAQLEGLERAIGPDGAVDPQKVRNVGAFGRPGSGWAWVASGPAGEVRSQSLAPRPPPGAAARRSLEDGGPPRAERRPGEERARREERRRRSRSGATETFYYRTQTLDTPRGPVTLTAGAPRYVRDRMRDQGVRPVILILSGLGAALLVAMLLQLELGLRPLRRLSASLARVRAGEDARVTGPQPAELTGVVTELNALLDHNEEALAKARDHVANLAHGLKTPLATLSVRLSEPGRDPDGSLGRLVAQIDAAIGHHLGRARAASPGAPGRPAVEVRSRLDDLVGALSRIHAERQLAWRLDAPADLVAQCDPQDFDEVIGNLLDNAGKWAAHAVTVSARREGRAMVLEIDDDGPGLDEASAAQALVRGRRLDEQAPGHGFGLSIARELAELHDGALSLSRAPLGGLRARLALPARSESAS